MSAQSVRLNTTASNLANANSVSSSIDETYRARSPIFVAALSDASGKYHGTERPTKPKPVSRQESRS